MIPLSPSLKLTPQKYYANGGEFAEIFPFIFLELPPKNRALWLYEQLGFEITAMQKLENVQKYVLAGCCNPNTVQMHDLNWHNRKQECIQQTVMAPELNWQASCLG